MDRRDFIRQGALYVLGAAIVAPYVRRYWPVAAVPWRESDADRLERLVNTGQLVYGQRFVLTRPIVFNAKKGLLRAGVRYSSARMARIREPLLVCAAHYLQHD